MIVICNHTPRPLEFTLHMEATERGESTEGQLDQTVEPGEDVFFQTWDDRRRGSQSYVLGWIAGVEFESPQGFRLVLEPADLLAHPSWWRGSGWSFAIVEREGELETAECTS